MKNQCNSTHSESEWLNIAKCVHENYSKNERAWIDKAKMLVVLEAFEALYRARITQNEEDYYIGNLEQPRLLVGRREDVIGTVPGNLERTKNSIAGPKQISGRQASIVARNLLIILSREQFRSDIGVLLAPHYDVLRELGAGQI